MNTPTELGFTMPAEWETHQATWLTWPHNPETWPGKLPQIEKVYVEMVKALSLGEHVHININHNLNPQKIQKLLTDEGVQNFTIHSFPTNDSWIRDYGPTFVKNASELALIHWGFNMWGGKYPPWDLDEKIPSRIAQFLEFKKFSPGMILEGGSIEADGCGTLLTTESCLLNPNRNPHLKKNQIEKILYDNLGVKKILWLKDGIVGDDTDGHIDDLTRFVAPGKVISIIEDHTSDANYIPLRTNIKLLEKMKDAENRSLEIILLPMPKPVINQGVRLPASYANFYIGNKVVLVPTFQDKNDEHALEIIASCFSTRKIIEIPARDLVFGLGACHCLTQQQPDR
ncbi:MAG: agmatine deiminase [Deltaproteobacteria bacterium RIFCSPLOWO2_12_FULL_40_28]|nr:MAG: agmatine deiminase [Deltaproteobacteria bacterium RIFCSPHIGHO2_02_FULL_40_28]OGQ20389.1 MAG: agmatine deiminase [Deltaproteobacteria bacterium RIFCSPHIGHO2_12_FULL_40_32]OGQ41358.1 MAG: agmatine deiminase [Deltaproteobacteria bacterium RIFCSPLOWO2_02_FULL_40_36]OGQ54997.1 MAG: agmatine deiminase [Deltaproteobacteria bacterium RIFCSPLOWO2_12_FULL_40_28]